MVVTQTKRYIVRKAMRKLSGEAISEGRRRDLLR